jgi:cell division inhibitor SepF
MAERLKRAAAWLGLVADDRYGDYDDTELTEGISREELVGQGAHPGNHSQSAHQQVAPGPTMTSTVASPAAGTHPNGSHAASVTPLEHRRPSAPAPSHPTPSISRAADLSRIITVHPRTYNEARTIGEHFRDGVPVIMNLSEMEDVDAKRLVDFAAGLIFGLRGTIERVTSKVFLLSPQNVNVTAEDKERIVGGFFNQS